MIPSLNKKANLEKLYLTSSEGLDQETINEYMAADKSYVCDCCMKEMGPATCSMEPEFWVVSWNPRLVKVGDATYFGCSSECARILFSIHHQYAMREASEEGRFVKDKYTGRTVDLDRVVMVTDEPYEVGTRWVKFFLDSNNLNSYVGFLVHASDEPKAEDYVNAWKKRRSPKA